MTCMAQLSPGDVTSTAMRVAEQESLELNFKDLAGKFKAPKLLGAGFVKHAEVVVEPQTADCAPASKIASSSPQSSQPSMDYPVLGFCFSVVDHVSAN